MSMDIYPGQTVMVKTVEELCAEFGFDEEDIRQGVDIGGLLFNAEMIQFCGHTYRVFGVDEYDNSLHLNETNLWFSYRTVRRVSEPGEFFGFEVGDKVEFRTVEDMKQDGSIGYNWFDHELEKLIGTRGVITDIQPENGQMARIWVKDESGNQIDHNLDTTMVEHIDESPEIPLDNWAAIAFV